ncbi:hypothetical protein [Streptomyces sp. NBC_01314]|uniref:hypothetical protein n=1 Tax=Streptomyces sp. NBC_01314 TaxID=2903821 RepID=UPI00352D3947
MGHPSESTHSTVSSAPHSAATDTAAPGHDPTGPPSDRVAGGHDGTDTSSSTSSHGPAMPMNVLSLCVAVLLGAWVLTALLRSALARHQEWPARLLAQVAVVARPDPPPRGPDLTRLSVLRL